jgi:hypothetical protein
LKSTYVKRENPQGMVRSALNYMRSNPQAAVLLFICVVLGLGTFFAVLISLLGSGGGQSTGDPDGSSIGILHAAVDSVRLLRGSL